MRITLGSLMTAIHNVTLPLFPEYTSPERQFPDHVNIPNVLIPTKFLQSGIRDTPFRSGNSSCEYVVFIREIDIQDYDWSGLTQLGKHAFGIET